MKSTIKETTRQLLQGTLTKDEADKILLGLHNVSVSSLIELMNIHLEPREELNHANNAIDIYIDGQRDLAEEIIKLINTNSR